jgi:hypothetical protein
MHEAVKIMRKHPSIAAFLVIQFFQIALFGESKGRVMPGASIDDGVFFHRTDCASFGIRFPVGLTGSVLMAGTLPQAFSPFTTAIVVATICFLNFVIFGYLAQKAPEEGI